MKRPELRKIASGFDFTKVEPGTFYVTMSIGQWDETLEAAYDNGATLIELDDNEKPIATYSLVNQEK